MFVQIPLIFLFVCTVVSHPVSQPVYSNQYVSGQTIPTIQFKPQTQGYLQPQQHTLVPQRPVYEQAAASAAADGGLQRYSSKIRQQPVQQVLLTANVDRQRIAQVAGPLYLHQVQAVQQQPQGQAHQEAVLAAQRKASQSIARPITAQPQYIREQPQIRYVQQRPQYRPQQQQQEDEQKDPEDYDPNPTYQFGFDVKDDLYTNYQNRKEQREGNKITGSYSVVDSDGFIRTVTYTADPKEGFKAEVTRQPTDIVVKIPKPDPQFQRQPQQQYVQAVPVQKAQRGQQNDQNVVYRYE